MAGQERILLRVWLFERRVVDPDGNGQRSDGHRNIQPTLRGNYHWWWQSFLTGSSSAFWVFGYCVWYFIFHLHITGFVSSLLFFSYSFLACAVYGLLTGTVGFLTAYMFVRRIYR